MRIKNSKTLKDLEFYTVLEMVSEKCLTEMGKEKVRAIEPMTRGEEVMMSLRRTDEYLSSFENGNYIPSHGFEEIYKELKMMEIEDSFLEVKGFVKIKNIVEICNSHISFFEKFAVYYPELKKMSEVMTANDSIVSEIDRVIDKFGEVKSDASERLREIRKEIGEVKGKIGASFTRALSGYSSADYLDEIRESVIEDRRVLAVKAMYRKRVPGSVMGTSKTGSIVYIEPAETERYNRELNNLNFEEKEEIVKILKRLTSFIREFSEVLREYQGYLIEVDVVYAKAIFGRDTNSILPNIVEERVLDLKEVFHPLLYLNNKKKGATTYPQNLLLDMKQRIIVISGPNAGGKSITLKTIGLLQLMLQSGMLVPVHRRSKFCFFERVLTDIGDNQSIENHLSTYSYRLKNMNYFLKKCNDKTLFLIDEFGTGSDPELGGALAETFLEEFYHRKAFGVITTHYANLKILADELECAKNANMLFNDKTLEPIYRLVVGEAGSSFTFEVAQKNGIPFGLINRAKKKLDNSKVRFDATISKLQKERNAMEKTSTSLKEEETKVRQEAKRMEELNDKIQSKLSAYQELYDKNQQLIFLGKKINEIAQRYFQTKNRRPLISDFLKIMETEASKYQSKTKEETKKKEEEAKKAEEAKKVEEEVKQKIVEIREQKKEIKKAEEEKKKAVVLKIGDRVRIRDSKSIGVVDKIEKEVVFINYGLFVTSINLEQVEKV